MIKGEGVHLAPQKKVVPASEFSKLVEADGILKQIQTEAQDFRRQVASEGEKLKEEAEKKGFEEGLKQWNEKIALLEKEISKVRSDMENSLVPLAMAAVKKIIGREIELKPETVVDLIATSLKSVSHHKKIALFVNKNDLEIVEKMRPQLKAIFEHLESLTIATREDVPPGGCIIETEAGIVNVGLESQLGALEAAFTNLVKNRGAL